MLHRPIKLTEREFQSVKMVIRKMVRGECVHCGREVLKHMPYLINASEGKVKIKCLECETN